MIQFSKVRSKKVCASFVRGDIGFSARFQEAGAVPKKQTTQNLVWLARTLCFVAAIFLVCSPCPAQIASAELSGNVLDASGAAVPNANITARNVETTIAHTTVSGKNGDYVLGDLPPGDYTVTVEATGFRKLEQTGVSLQVNQQARIDLALQVGQTAETVSVTGHLPLLESESSSVGTVINVDRRQRA
jgi:hypothetical protein